MLTYDAVKHGFGGSGYAAVRWHGATYGQNYVITIVLSAQLPVHESEYVDIIWKYSRCGVHRFRLDLLKPKRQFPRLVVCYWVLRLLNQFSIIYLIGSYMGILRFIQTRLLYRKMSSPETF